jgi:hypothetical protein
MAPASKTSSRKRSSSSKAAKRNGSGAKSTAKTAKRTAKTAKRNGSGAKSTAKRASKGAGAAAEPRVNAIAAKDAAAAGTKAAGKAVAAAASKAKTPLIVGGAAIAGVAGGLVAKNRVSSSKRGRRPRFSLPTRDGKLDLDAVASAARRVGAMGEQVGEIANALERAGLSKKP